MSADDPVQGPQPSLGDVMSRVARELRERHRDVEATHHAIAQAAVGTVPGAAGCSITYVIGQSRVEPRAASDDLPRLIDELQEQVGQGPCLDAAWEQEVVRVDDMRSEQRWPKFARQASTYGVGSMICFQLFVDGDRRGALNLVSRTPRAFGDDAEGIGRVFASHAAVALAGAEQEASLRTGMDSRDVIGQAKGILMERFRLPADEAFAVLARVSQDQNRKLVDIARELAETGAMPEGDRRD